MAKSFGRVIYQSRFPAAAEGLRKQARLRGQLIGNEIRSTIVLGMSQPHAGRTYRVPGTKRMYTASAPGEYPAVRTGALKASVKTIYFENSAGHFTAMTGTHLPYGIYLELGTRRMAPRPWLSRGIKEARAKILKILQMPWKIL